MKGEGEAASLFFNDTFLLWERLAMHNFIEFSNLQSVVELSVETNSVSSGEFVRLQCAPFR